MDTKIVRRRFATLLLFAALALAIIGLVLLREISGNSENFSRLYQTILLINAANAVVLLSLIIVNLVRLFRDKQKDVPGARLKARLVGAFVLLVIAPMAVVYVYSIQFLSEGIDSWFDVKVERGLTDALDLSRNALDMRMRENLDQTRLAADSLSSLPDMQIYAYLPELRMSSNARELSVFAGGSKIIATSSADPSNAIPLLPTDEILLTLRQQNFYVSLEPRPDDEYFVRTAILLPSRFGAEPRIVQALYPLGKGLGPLANSVQNTVTRYTELAFLRKPLKSSLTLTLSIVVLISLLLAVYGAFFFARRLSAPVQSLVAGTRAVARGELDTRLPSGERDEIGFLVDSFNDMIEQLSAARAEARRSEAQVENERASVEAILARLSSGVIALEKNLTIRTSNQAADKLLNQDLRSQEGRLMESVAADNPALKKVVDIFMDKLAQGETDWRTQVRLTTDSVTRVLVCACTVLPGSYRSRGGYVLVFDDVSELLQAQREAAWGEVARRLAHEIKNPLTPIQLSAERIRRKFLGTVDESSSELLDRATQTIVQQVEAMRDMVDAFSEYARAPAMNRTNFDLNRLIRQVADLYPAHRNQLPIRLELDETLPAVNLDAVRIRQVLHNLIRNALEAMEGQEDSEIVIRSYLLHKHKIDCVGVSVRDNGPGLPEEDREKIFEPYVTTKSKGTGLGLAIVKKLVEEHGGEVEIESELDEGTCVTIVLPIGKTKDADSAVQNGGRTRRISA
ncbi:MAG: ATP-binding protein [Gammaproteobacteria bacterium]